MAYIQKTKERLAPGTDNPFFLAEPTSWVMLKSGEPVWVPDVELDFQLSYFGASVVQVAEPKEEMVTEIEEEEPTNETEIE